MAATIGGAGFAAAQTLSCPPNPVATSRPCEVYHYHVQMFRPENRQFVELYGINQFSSQAACGRAREAQSRHNLSVVDYFKRVRGDERYEPDRFGACHCDMTIERSSSNYLTDVQRAAQLRTAEEIRLRVRERLLDQGVTSDNDLVRGLIVQQPSSPVLNGPRIVPVPTSSSEAPVNAVSELLPTKAVDTSRPTAAANLDLPLVEIAIPEEIIASPPPPPLTEVTVTSPTVSETPATTEPVEASGTIEESSTTEESRTPVNEGAENFISYETQRIQNVLKASAAIADGNVKAKIFEACMQRIQLLSNLRGLIQGSGVRSRLATAARTAQNESERLNLVSNLFGRDIMPHWAPKDAADVILDARPEVENDPEKALRATGLSDQLRRRAFYLLLARTQPTEEQQLWLITVADAFLR